MLGSMHLHIRADRLSSPRPSIPRVHRSIYYKPLILYFKLSACCYKGPVSTFTIFPFLQILKKPRTQLKTVFYFVFLYDKLLLKIKIDTSALVFLYGLLDSITPYISLFGAWNNLQIMIIPVFQVRSQRFKEVL